MEIITGIDFARIFFGEQSLVFMLEVMFRVLVVYAIALVFLRAGGKRARKQMTPIEMLLIVALGSSVGDAMLYSDVPLLFTVIIIISVVVFQFFFARLKIHSSFFEKFVDCRPNMVVKEGEVLYEALDAEAYTVSELESELRMKGVRDLGEVQYAYLELGGGISVFTYPKGEEKKNKSITPVPEEDGFMKV